MAASISNDHPRLLIIEQDSSILTLLLQAFPRSCMAAQGDASAAELLASSMADSHFCHCAYDESSRPCFIVAKTMNELRRVDVAHMQAAICGPTLHDADGLDVITHLRETRSDLPVIFITTDPAQAVLAMRRGAIDVLSPPNEHDLHALPLAVEKCLALQRIMSDNIKLHEDLKRSLHELTDTNHQLQSVIRQLETMARTDELTGLSNRRWFNLMLHGYWADATRTDLPLACLMIDLDGFKDVNDKLGHDCGDDMLRLAAKVIRANCREEDVPSRIGGDEFCILLANTKADDAAAAGQRILKAFEFAIGNLPEEHPRVSMSIGVANAHVSRPAHADQLVTHGDEAMYAAKGAGKNRVMLRLRKGVGDTQPLALPMTIANDASAVQSKDAA